MGTCCDLLLRNDAAMVWRKCSFSTFQLPFIDILGQTKYVWCIQMMPRHHRDRIHPLNHGKRSNTAQNTAVNANVPYFEVIPFSGSVGWFCFPFISQARDNFFENFKVNAYSQWCKLSLAINPDLQIQKLKECHHFQIRFALNWNSL